MSLRSKLEKIRNVFREGVLIKKVKFKKASSEEAPLFHGILKRGMYVRHRKKWAEQNLHRPHRQISIGHWSIIDFNYEKQCAYMMVTEVLVDENGFFKFQFIGPAETGWSAWLLPTIFNLCYEVKNPWV